MLRIGTSGWNYGSWRGLFYPAKLPAASFLDYYAGTFETTEVNYSFYHLPKQSTYQNWASKVPENFVFALKVSRFITHTKRLAGVGDAWQKFVDNASSLSGRLGPLLIQLPSSFHTDVDRLTEFLELAASQGYHLRLRLVFEFRHRSWFDDKVYSLLRQYNAALCIADSPAYPRENVVTADFAYFRFHGRKELFRSSYTEAELEAEAKEIRKLIRKRLDVYVYFNNDIGAHAVSNARTLKALLTV